MLSAVHRIRIAVCLGAVLLAGSAAFAAPPKSEYVETIEQTHALNPGGRFSLSNRNGNVTIETWDKHEVHVVAIKRMRPNNHGVSWLMRLVGLKAAETATDEEAQKLFAEFKVEIAGDASNRTVTTHYPAVQGVEFDVTYRVTLPREVMPTIETTNSTVEVTGVDGDTVVDTTNGKVILTEIAGAVRANSTNGRLVLREIAGAVEGETTNGSVSLATRSAAPLAGPINLRSTNGSVDVTVPASANFDLELRTVNGSASCDLPLTSTTEQSRKRLQGVVGNGGPLITLRTTNGSVRVEAAT